jgi:hypothetical protein
MPPERGEEMTDTPPGAVPPSGHRSWSTHPTTHPPRIFGAADLPFLPRLQHAPRGVDIQDLRPLRGRPYGPIPDTDAYPGAPTNPQKKLNPPTTRLTDPAPFRDDLGEALR